MQHFAILCNAILLLRLLLSGLQGATRYCKVIQIVRLVGSSFFMPKALILKGFKALNYFLITNLITFKTKKTAH